MAVTKEAALIEVHDGIVRAIRVCPGSSSVVIFDHLAVYCEVEDEVFEIWSFRGRLVLEGVEEMSLQGRIASDDYLMDGAAEGPDGTAVPWTDLLGGAAIRQLTLQFFSGAEFLARCQKAELSLGRRLEIVEIWRGPL